MWHLIIVVRGFLKKMKRDHVGAYAAQSAYFLALSFIPIIMLLLSLVQYIPVLDQQDIVRVVISIFPDSFQEFIVEIIEEVFLQSAALVPVSALVMIWSAAKGLMSLANGLNVIYHVDETRNYVLNRIRAGIYTLLFIIAIVLSLVLLVFGNSIQKALSVHFPPIGEFAAFLISIRTILVLAVLAIVFSLVYKFVPNRKAKLKSQIPGASLSAAAWIIFSFGFSIYIDNFSNMSKIYGSLTTVVLIMLWLYFCMYIILTGAEVNAYFEERFRKIRSEITAWKDSRSEKDEGPLL